MRSGPVYRQFPGGNAAHLGVRVAVLIVGLFAIFSGTSSVNAQSAISDRLAALAPELKLTAVETRVRGLVVPRHRATISSRLQATISKIGPDNGERFVRGDVLVAFDCDVFQAELARARSQARATEANFLVKTKLAKAGTVSRLQSVLARAEHERATADISIAQVRVSHCVLKAPFSGRVVRRIANAFETVNFRDPLIEILSDKDVEIRAFVPSNWLRVIQIGSAMKFVVDETGESVTAEIIALGAQIDNVSQLLEVRARPKSGQIHLVAGMSGQTTLENLQ